MEITDTTTFAALLLYLKNELLTDKELRNRLSEIHKSKKLSYHSSHELVRYMFILDTKLEYLK